MQLLKPAFLFLFFMCSFFRVSLSQDLENLGGVLKTKKKDIVKISGGMSASSIIYAASGREARRQAFTWQLNGNLNIRIADKIDLPFSFGYSNQQFTYSRPQAPNIVGLSPRYKWVQLHVGNRSMSFSDYTLAGMAFSGVGVELTPDKFNISAMYGRINRAVASDSLISPDAPSAYNRTGYGAKVAYNDKGREFAVMFFHGKDDPSSLSFVPSDSLQTPAANLSFGFKMSLPLLKKFKFTAETGLSAYNNNILLSGPEYSTTYSALFKPFFRFGASSKIYRALKTALSYQHKYFSIGTAYEHIDPEYRTMGSYFFNNDLENITLNVGLKLFKSRFNLAANAGRQRNNLNNSESSETSRWVSAFNVSGILLKKLNINAGYSNFQNVSRVRPVLSQFDSRTDSLNLSQVNQNANLSLGYNFGNKKMQQGVQCNVSYQTANSIRNGLLTDHQSDVWNTVLSYRLSFPKSKLSLNASVNRNESIQTQAHTLAWGPNVSLNKSWLKKDKLRTGLSVTYNAVARDGSKESDIYNFRGNVSLKVSDKQQLRSSLSLISRSATQRRPDGLKELTININYSYTF